MYNDGPNASTALRDTRSLEQISVMADRVESMNERLSGFLGRYHGRDDKSPSGVQPVPAGYQGQIDRLSGLLVNTENLAIEISALG